MSYPTEEYNVCTAYVCPLQYGDMSGLEDGDINDVLAFEKMILEQSKHHQGHANFSWSDDPEFCRDDVSGLMADCLTLTVIYI